MSHLDVRTFRIPFHWVPGVLLSLRFAQCASMSSPAPEVFSCPVATLDAGSTEAAVGGFQGKLHAIYGPM